jgi:hypothetical protein
LCAMKIRHGEGKQMVGVHPAKYDVTKTNDGIDRLLAVFEPRSKEASKIRRTAVGP